MALVRHDVIEEVFVGDKKALEFLFYEADGVTPTDLTGWAAIVSFWHEDLVPHITRSGDVGGLTGIVSYELRGDEYDAVGEVLLTCTVFNTEYGGTSTGQGYFERSFPVVRRLVRRKPG
jgi:hypothetical protein